ncbi:squamous cell carcinoma antigen recognized by T-cells 3 isoform X2 [Dunckerocampus dactyliophorus]|uniref:squamous cell carcinoma antigen recognized by T-cells 3 isoform X2 n=1 Tax=Dunckerocampus dactyliophorus TaxID=161453 RepID=UPI002406EE5B|nr:squamous cell carcinoma antigen recognized by T-cells 3 isoform X2 [Dunckerocampus dactyliophorus]
MAASSNAEHTHLQDMDEDDAGIEEREMDSESDDEEGMGVENSDDTSEDEKENEAEIQRLEEQLSINAFDYNCHVDLIKLLKQEGELVRLRKARQKMSELFPLTEEIWLDWLKDEIRLNEEEPNREKVNELFERAVKDYICPDIWLEYAQYSIGGMGSPGGIERVRSIFERAITAVGLHMTKGQTVWEAYREFENAILATVQPAPGRIPNHDEQELLNKQLQRIHTLFRRQLAIPLMDMEATYAEYEDWSDHGPPEIVLNQYKKALQQKEKCKPFEESLLVAETPKLAEYQTYIDFEMKAGDPARIQITFERALAENCLVPDMWTKFTTYLDRQLKIKDLVLSTHDRAVRNCPWTMGLWKSYLLAVERHGGTHQTVTDVFEKALNAGFIQAKDYVEIWQAYLEYLRRRVDFSQESSKELEELRGAFTRCLDYIKQDVEESSLEDWDVAVQKTETRLNRLNEQRAKVAEKEAIHAQQEEDLAEQRRKAKTDKKAQKKLQKGGRFGEKRKADVEQDEWNDNAEQAPKRHRGNGEQSTEEYMETETGLLGRNAPSGYKGSAPGNKKSQQASVQKQSHDKPELRDDSNSVFVSNLTYTLEEPEAKLRALFEPCGPIKQIRLVSSNKGSFKGYGYVEFESSVSVHEALKLDRSEVEGRPVFVSPCVDKNKNPYFKVFKYNTSMEKHKIFIQGLPFSCTKEQLEEISRCHGTVKEVRLVTYRSGKPKGLAYVEFADEAQASQAVLKMDGTYVDHHQIRVAISNPPRRFLPGPNQPAAPLMPRPVHGGRGRGRTQLSLLPRSLHRQSGPASKVENGTAHERGAGDALSNSLSNSDFAKMLLNK